MHKLDQRVKKLEENIISNENKRKQYFVGVERMTIEEWNDYIKNPTKWIRVLPDKMPEGFIIRLKNVRLP